MRLINADEFKNQDILEQLRTAEFDDEIEKVIKEIPTAYDVDKVIEKIREYADNIAEFGGNFLPQVVIEIVKSGGAADE